MNASTLTFAIQHLALVVVLRGLPFVIYRLAVSEFRASNRLLVLGGYSIPLGICAATQPWSLFWLVVGSVYYFGLGCSMNGFRLLLKARVVTQAALLIIL